jgi:tetrahydromethanopterin S-methyltransferase subunit B|tara:strand:- start:884 stop:1063 length:180 start_codon:yes stop_codon:yes gene_type:complete
MTFRIVDSDTGKILFDTSDITKLMEKLEYYEDDMERPVKEIFPRTSELGEEMKITGRRK